MEDTNTPATPATTLGQRMVAVSLAAATTGFIATSVVAVFTGNAGLVGSAVARVALTPIRVLLGG